MLSSLLFLFPTGTNGGQAEPAAPASPVTQRDEGTRPAPPRTVLCLGDSLTAGYGLADPMNESFPALIQKKIDASGLRKTVVINAGSSGDTSAGGLRRIDWLLRQRVDVLVLALGANDGLRGIATEETRRNLQGIIDKTSAKNPTVRVLIAGMKLPPNLGTDYTNRFEAMFSVLAKANEGTILIPFLLEGVGGLAEFNQRDGVHPTALGQRRMAETVWEYLKPLLE